MLNEIIDGIAVKLNLDFGDDYTIYTESVEQGTKEPCFFILLLPTNQTQVIGKRYFRKHPFDIHYFPTVDGGNAEILDVIDKLNDSLEYITVGSNLVRGSKLHGEVVDGILHYFVEYNFHVTKSSEEVIDEMETVQVESNVKGRSSETET